MNSLFVTLGIESWKSVLGAFLLPPTPLLVLVLVGAWLLPTRRRLGAALVAFSVAGLWLVASGASADLVSRWLLHPPPALGSDRMKALTAEMQSHPSVAIIVLGGGMEPYAPEYDNSDLSTYSLERLRYGIWLGRATGLPVGFSGGVGHGLGTQGTPEAVVAARIAAQEYGRPLKWLESESRDTRENASRTVELMRRAGIDHIVLVTNDFHMRRALRAFREAAGSRMRIEPAPMGLPSSGDSSALNWLPSGGGMKRMRDYLHEVIGYAAGS
ncbi:MAG: YdcF family protein [Caldimonas sp.]